MIVALGVFFIALLIIIGGERGAVTLISLFCNLLVLWGSLQLLTLGVNPLGIAFLACFLINCSTLFYQNGKNAKTIASFGAVLLVSGTLFLLAVGLCGSANLQGIHEVIQQGDQLQGLSSDIQLSMTNIAVLVILIGLLGATMDTSIAISSAVYEVYRNNRGMTAQALFSSGMHIGGDILGTTVNTLYFAYLGEAMTLLIYYKDAGLSFSEIINAKSFFQDFAAMMFSGIGCVAMIPITAGIVSFVLTHPEKFKKYLEEDELFAEKSNLQ